MIQLNQQDINELLQQGHTMLEIQEALGTVNQQDISGGLAQDHTVKPPPAQLSAFTYNPSDNLVKWQLELNDILERAEHILKEDIIVTEQGVTYWAKNPKPDDRIFNDYGVQEILRILHLYINRNTILSDYEPKEINDKVYDFGKEMNDLIFMKYERFGLINEDKRKNYPMLVRQLIDIVHSSYKRALYGGERTSLREARQIQQTETIMPSSLNLQTGEQRKERGLLNPMRLLRGRYA